MPDRPWTRWDDADMQHRPNGPPGRIGGAPGQIGPIISDAVIRLPSNLSRKDVAARIREFLQEEGLRGLLNVTRWTSMSPGHDRDGRHRVLRRAFDNLAADRHVDQRIPVLIDDPVHLRVLEKHGS